MIDLEERILFGGMTAENPAGRKASKRVEGKEKIAAAILSWLRSQDPTFVTDKAAEAMSGYPSKPDGETGWILKTFRLSDLRRETGRESYELDDALIMEALDSLSSSGQVRVVKMELRQFDKTGDCFFKAVLGGAVRETFYPNNVPTLRLPVWFEKVKGFPGRFIQKPSLVLAELRAAREEELKKRFGRVDFLLEKKLIHEKIMDEARLRRAIEKLLESGEAGK